MTILMETSWDWAAMETFSKSVFRQEHRLAVAVMARAAQPQELYAQAIAKKLGLSQPEVRKHLRDLAEAGLLTKRTQKGPDVAQGWTSRSALRQDRG